MTDLRECVDKFDLQLFKSDILIFISDKMIKLHLILKMRSYESK